MALNTINQTNSFLYLCLICIWRSITHLVFFYITVSAMIIFISQNEYMLSQEYKELRQQISKSDRTMSQNIKGIYLLNFFLFQYFYGPAARHWVFPMSIHTSAQPPFDFHPSSTPVILSLVFPLVHIFYKNFLHCWNVVFKLSKYLVIIT